MAVFAGKVCSLRLGPNEINFNFGEGEMAKLPPVKKSAPAKAVPEKAAAVAIAKATLAPAKYSLVELRDDVAASLPLVAKATIEKVILATFEKMTTAYAAGSAVNIKDFGKLEIKNRPERQGRNPKTGETMTIAAKSVPKFTFAKKLKDAVK